jgi:hypothetical protein
MSRENTFKDQAIYCPFEFNKKNQRWLFITRSVLILHEEQVPRFEQLVRL